MLMEIIGWVGSLLVIVVYALNSYQKIRSDSFLFYAMNLVGGILLVIYSMHKEAYPNVVINVVWVVVALPAIIRLVLKARKP